MSAISISSITCVSTAEAPYVLQMCLYYFHVLFFLWFPREWGKGCPHPWHPCMDASLITLEGRLESQRLHFRYLIRPSRHTSYGTVAYYLVLGHVELSFVSTKRSHSSGDKQYHNKSYIKASSRQKFYKLKSFICSSSTLIVQNYDTLEAIQRDLQQLHNPIF